MESRCIQFGEFTYWPDSGRLRSPHGEQTLRPQVSRLLEHFLAHPDRVLDRASLIAAVWGEGRVVEFEAGLAALIKELRSALGDSASAPRYLETVPRRGVRWLVAPRETAEEGAASSPAGTMVSRDRRRSWLVAMAVGLVVLAGVLGLFLLAGEHAAEEESEAAGSRLPRVAVLPFLSIDEADRGARASLLLADSTIAALASIVSPIDEAREQPADAPFAVIGRTSITGYPAGEGLAMALAEDLGVDLVVEGSYRREGEAWLINVSVVRVREQTILLSRTFLVTELSSRVVRDHLQGFSLEMAGAVRRCGSDCLAE